MRVINLTAKSRIYTANVFLVLGDFNCLEDVNTLIDVGRDPAVLERINGSLTGVGKKKVDQVVLTHNHYDHAGLLPRIREIFNPVVYAYSSHLKGIDRVLSGGEIFRIGDRLLEIIYTPGHSSDSICIFCEDEGTLFAGDTPFFVRATDEIYEECFIETLEKLCSRNIVKIYPGHGNPITKGSKTLIYESLENVKRAYREQRS